MVYGLDIDDTNIYFSAGNIAFYVPKSDPGSEPVQVCDCTELMSPTSPSRPGQIYGLSANLAADELYVVGATGDAKGVLVTCSISQAKITRTLGEWDNAQDGERFVVAIRDGTSLGVGEACTQGSCGQATTNPAPTYPTGVTQVSCLGTDKGLPMYQPFYHRSL